MKPFGRMHRIVFPIAVAAAMAGCGDNNKPAYPHEQTVEQLHTLPSVVYIAPGDAVVLSARLLGYDDDQKVIVLPEWVRDPETGVDVTLSEHTVTWKFTESAAGVTFAYLPESPGHHRVRVAVAAGVSITTDAALEARVDGEADVVKIVVRHDSPAQGAASNQIIGAAPQGTPPPDGLGLVAEEVGGGAAASWGLRGYSSSLEPSDVVTTGAGSGTELKRGSGLWFHSFTAAPTGGDVLGVPLRFWIATHGIVTDGSVCDSVCKLKRHVKEDLEVANDIYDKNRTGIRFFNIDGQQIRELPDLADFVARACSLIVDEIDASSWPLKAELASKQLHVVYSQGKQHDMRGIECANDDGTGLLVVFFSMRAPTTLAHELGHALAQNYRTGMTMGHPTSSHPGFDAGNLMWSGLELRQATDRGRILAGQSRWMNVDKESHLNLVPGLRPTGLTQADCFLSPKSCPSLSLRMESAQ